MYVTDRYDKTLAVKVALNLNTTNQQLTNIFTVVISVVLWPTSTNKHGVYVCFDLTRD